MWNAVVLCNTITRSFRERVFRRGPSVCISARDPKQTPALYERLRAAEISPSLRENALRISPHIYNTLEDISRLTKTRSD